MKTRRAGVRGRGHSAMNRTLIAAIAAAVLAAGAARADTVTLHGGKLIYMSGTDDESSIQVDPELHGGIRIDADDPSCLTTHAGSDIVVDTSSCGGNLGHLTIDVPQGFAVTATIRNSGNVTIGNTDGDLQAIINGDGDLHAGRVRNLVLVVTGSGDSSVQAANGVTSINSGGNGDIRIGEVTGPLQSRQTSSGDLVIGRISSSAVDMTQDSSGDAVIGPGTVGALRAALSGSGDLAVAATVDTADLSATGGGDIHVARVTGDVQRHASGGSSISTTGLGVGGALLSKLSQINTSDSDGDTTIHVNGSDVVIGHGHGGGSGFVHFLAFAAFLFLIYVMWRAVQRRGGVASVRNSLRPGSGGAGQPTHPGVIAVRDKLAELDAKLARVETYVTNREFDLHRKFRELDTR